MKRLVIAFALLILLSGVTISVLKWLEIGPFSQSETEEAAVGTAKEIDESTRFIEMEPMVVPIFQGDQVAASIQISLKLETTGAENEAKIKRMMPRLSHAFLRDLYAFIPRLLKREERLDVAILKRRLLITADNVLESGTVDDILVQSVVDTASP